MVRRDDPWHSGFAACRLPVGGRRFESAGFPLVGWPGCYINGRHCRGLSKVLLQLKDPLELFVKRKEFLPSSIPTRTVGAFALDCLAIRAGPQW